MTEQPQGDKSLYDMSKIDLEMRAALSHEVQSDNVFKKLGMVGRCLYNLMLLDEITGAQAVRILEVLKLHKTSGATSANMRRVVRTVKSKITDLNDQSLYPFMSVFWLVPHEQVRLKIMEVNARLAELQAASNASTGSNGNSLGDVLKIPKQNTGLVPITDAAREMADQFGTNGSAQLVRLKPVDALHELGTELKSFYATEENVRLASKKVFHDVLISILKYDTDSLKDFDVNAVMEQFDHLGDFILQVDLEHPDVDLIGKYRAFLLGLEASQVDALQAE